MADKPGLYWDHRECGWVKCDVPDPRADLPAQPQPAEIEDARATPPVGNPR